MEGAWVSQTSGGHYDQYSLYLICCRLAVLKGIVSGYFIVVGGLGIDFLFGFSLEI